MVFFYTSSIWKKTYFETSLYRMVQKVIQNEHCCWDLIEKGNPKTTDHRCVVCRSKEVGKNKIFMEEKAKYNQKDV